MTLLLLSLAVSLVAVSEIARPANAVTSNSNPPTIAKTGDNGVYQSSYQSPGFYAQGRYWVFYVDPSASCEHQAGCLFYVWSVNGATLWSTPVSVGVHATDNDWSVVTDGTFAYYARYNETSFDSTANRALLFGMGQLGNTGVINWQSEQIVLSPGSAVKFPNDVIGVDSNGQIWVGYQQDNSGTRTPHIIHSNSTLPPQPLSTSFVVNASNPTILQTLRFNATATGGNWGGTSGYAFSWSFGDGATANGQSVTHQYSSPGNYTVALNTIDNGNPQQTASSAQTVPVGLLLPSTNTPPTLQVPASRSVKTGTPVSFTVTSSDNDGDTVTLSSGSLPVGASFNPSNGLFTWITTPDQANQFWSISFNTTDNRGLSVMKQVLVYVSPSWSGDFSLSTSVFSNWHVDIATLLGGGQVYASYWADGQKIFGRSYNTGWGPEELISGVNSQGQPLQTSVDVNSFLFASGGSGGVSAIYYNTVNESLYISSRGPQGGWGPNIIAHVGVASAGGLGRYSLPFTAAFDQGDARWYVFWYYQTTNTITEWSGADSSWLQTNSTFPAQSSVAGSTIGSFHYSSSVNGKNAFGVMWIDGTTSPYDLNFGLEAVGQAPGSCGPNATCDSSWNPRVTCTAQIVTIEQILGSQSSTFGGATESGSIFNPGIRAPGKGDAKRWLTPGPTPPQWTPNGPPCTITNADGQTVGAFVEILGVQRGFLLNEDYSTNFDPVNGASAFPSPGSFGDTTFNIFTPGYGICKSTNTTGCMHTMHAEIDRDWKAAGYCGPNTVCDVYPMASGPVSSAVNKTRIDVQGFIYWDPDHADEVSHSFSGWEIHPLTGWRVSCPQAGYLCSPSFSLSATPHSVTISPGKSATANITINSSNLFSGRVNFTATISPPGSSAPTVVFNPSNYNVTACNLCGVIASKLNITTTTASSGTYNITITARSSTVTRQASILAVMVGFNMTSSPSTLNIPASTSAQSTVTVTSLGYAGTVSLSAQVSGCGCLLSSISPSQVALSVGGKASATLNVTAFSPGNALVTITGTSSTSPSFTVTTTVSVNVVDFTISAGQTSLRMYPGSPNSTVITLTSLNGFSGSVTIKATSTPAGLTQALNSSSVSLQPGGTVHVLLVVNGTQPGIYTVTVNATSGSASHLLTITVNVVDFSLSSASVLRVNLDSTGSATINVASLGGFVGTISLSNSTSSSALHDALSAQVVSLSSGGSGSAILTVYGTSAGNYTVTITATSGPLRHIIVISVNVVDFQISAGPVTPASLNIGSRGNATITVTRVNGFTGIVALSISAPPGVTCSLSSTRLTLPPSPVTSILSCSSSTANDYTVTVTGTNGTLTHTTANILFHIVDFTITPSLSSLSLVVGQSQQTTVNLLGANGFSGNVNLNVLITPSSPSGTFSPGSVTLTSTGCKCGSSILAINAGLTAGLYTLNVTGTNGALTHWEIINLTVTKDNPSITTNLSSTTIVAGASVTDSASLTGATSTASGTVTYLLFANGACTAPANIVSTVAVTNNLIPNSRAVVLNATGSYSFNATYSGDNNNGPASSACEPVAVQKDNPTLATSLSLTSIQVGQSVTDSATLASFFQAGGTVNYNLFVGSGTCIGPSSTIATVIITNGVIPNSRSVTFNSTNPAGYSFQAVYSGDANNKGAASGCEPLTVNPVGVTVTTGLSATTITVGGTVSDASTLHGQTSTAGGTITYNDFANGNCAAPGAVISMVTVNNGVVPNSRTVTFNSSGTFSFNAVYSGDANNNGAASGCELLTVNKAAPTITTSISPSTTITVGGSVTDQTSLTGGFPSTGVTGTVTYTLFSFSTLPSATAPCAAGTIVGTSQTVNVGVGNSVPAGVAVTPPSPGFFGFSAVYNGNGNNTAATGNCEPLTVNKQTPTITTAINPSSSVVVGVSATDQATITGGFPSTGVSGTVTYRFFGPGNGVCSGVSVSSQVVAVGAGNSVSPSNSQTPSSAGQYSFNATYSGDTNNNQVTSSCELLTVSLVSTTTGIGCGSSVTVGVPTSCTITVSDVAPGTLTPTGAVNLSTNSSGTFSPPSPCTLSGTTSSASCTVTYTPLVLGAHNITATYTGDNKHGTSAGFAVLSPGKHSTSTSISCSGPVLVNQASTCTATVTDTSTLGATTPGGSVGFAETGVTGNFNVTSCTLIGSGSSASCGVKFNPSAPGTASVVGSYSGDSTHSSSSNGGSPAQIAVNPAITVSTPIATPSAIDSGQSVTLSATFSGGTSPFMCQWLQKTPGGTSYSSLGGSSPCTSPVSISSGILTTVGSWSFELQLADSSSSPVTVASGPVGVAVNAALSLPTISASPIALDLGQSSTLATTTSFSGGTAPYVCQWLEKAPGAAGYNSLGASFSCIVGDKPTASTGSLSTVGSWSFELKVTDTGSPAELVTSAAFSVTINPTLTPPLVSANPLTINSGQTVTLSTTTSFGSGTPTYVCQWLLKAPGASIYTNLGSSIACVAGDKPTTSTGALSTTGTWSFELEVNDSGSPSEPATSNAVAVTVNGVLSAGTISPSAPAIDAGQSITFTSNPSGGTAPYSYQWYSDGTCTASIGSAIASTLNASPTSTSTYSVKVTDSASSSQCSPSDTVTVNPALVAGAVTPSAPTIDSGQSITLSANSSGGTTPYHYQWYSGASVSCSSDTTLLGATSTQVVSPPANTYYCYTVADSAFAPVTQSSAADLVTVDPTLVAGPISPLGPTIDSGQSVTLTSNPSGGTSPYSYQWYAAASCTSGSLISGASSSAYIASPPSTANYFYKVTDSSQGSPSASQCSPGDLVTVNPALVVGAITPASPTIDSGQSITLTSHASGGTPSLTYQWYSDGACTTAISSATLSTYSASPSSAATYSYKATDSAFSPTSQCSSGDAVSVNPALVAQAISPTNPAINGGQSITLTANPSGGTIPYNYQWYSDGTCNSVISPATSSTYSTSPSVTTTYSYKVTDTANAPASRCSPADTVTVNSAIIAGAITPTNPSVDSGQSIALTSHVSGGTPPLSYQWYSDGTCGTAVAGATSPTFTDSPSATTSYSYKVTDSSQSPSSGCSPAETVTVNPALTAGPLTPSAPTIDAGQSISLTSHASGGTPSISYRWYADGTCSLAISGATSSTYVTTPSVTTTYTYLVTDSAYSPVSQCSTADIVTVNAALVAGAITPSTPTIDAGQSVTLNTNPSGGTTPYTYQWYSAASCPSGSLITGASLSTYAASPTSTTTYSYRVTDSSQGAQNNSQCSSGDLVTVNPPLMAGAITPSSPTIDSGQTVTLTSHASGGTPSLSYQWYSDGACTTAISGATLSTYSASSASASIYSYKAIDSAFSPTSQCSSGDTVAVNPALVAGGITPSGPAINAGQSIALTANPSGGTAPYSYLWYSDGICNSLVASATSPTYSTSPSVTTTYSYKVTDTAFSPVPRCSPGDTVTVNSAIVAGAITPPNPTIDGGQSVMLTSHVSGGTPSFSYQWYSDGTCGTAIPSATSATFTSSPSATSSYSYKVNDSAQSPASACSPAETVTVNPALIAGSVTPSAPTIDAGQSITLTSHASGGTLSISYRWYSDGACSLAISGATSSTYVTSPSVTTTYAYLVTDSAYAPVSQCSPANIVTVNSALVAGGVTPSAPTINTGQSITLNANPSGGTTPYAYQWYSAANCQSANLISGASSSTYSASPTSTTTYSYKATDSSQGGPIASSCSPGDTVTVNGVLFAGAISPNSPTIDSGQSIALTANPSSGSAPYSYQWYSDGTCTAAIPSATSSSYNASPTATATYSYKVTDLASASQCSPGDIVTVNPALVAGAITPPSPTIDNGQSISLSAAPSAGTLPYSYQWFAAASCVSGSQVSGAASSTLVVSPSSTTTYSYRVMDSSIGSPAASTCSAGNVVTISPSLIAGAITPPGPTIDNGQSILLTSAASGGTTTYSYQWFTGGTCTTAIPSATSSTYNALPASSTTYSYRVTDSAFFPVSRCSSGNIVTVNSALAAGAITPASPRIDSGQSITLAANPSGGTTPYTYQWYLGVSASCSSDTTLLGTTSTQIVSPTANTYYCYSVTDSAFTPASQSSITDLVTIDPVLVAGTITPLSPTIDIGQSITLTANPSGGTGPYTYQWYSGTSPDCSSDTAPLGTSSTQLVSSSSSAYYCYRAADSSAGNPSASAISPTDLVTVNPVLSISSFTTTSPIDSGQTASIMVSWSGGTSPYTLALFTSSSSSSCTNLVQVGQNPGVVGTTASFTQSPTTTTSYCASVTDGASSPTIIRTATPRTVVVNPALAVNNPTAGSAALDSSQQSTLSATFTGGTSPYACQWLQKAPGATVYSNLDSSSACSSSTSSSTGVLATVGSWSFEVQVTDTGSPSVIITSNPIIITVNPPLTSPAILATPSTIGAGGSSMLSTTTSFTGGTTPHTCQWLKKGPLDGNFGNFGSSFGCVAGDKPSVSSGPLSTSGIWSFELQVSDSGTPSQAISSNAASITVNGALSAGAIAPGTPAIDFGQSITLTSNAFSGVTPYAYQWYSDGNCGTAISSGTSSTFLAAPTATATYSYKVTDFNGVHQCSPGDTVTVNSALAAGVIAPSAPTIDSGQSVALAASPSGGTAPYSYQWYSDASCTSSISGATGSTLLVSPSSTTTYTYKLGDASQGTLASSQCSGGDTVTVNSALVVNPITPSNPTIDNGQSITLTSHASSGTAPISYQWYSDGMCGTSITGATSSTYTAFPTSTNTYSYKVADSAFSPASLCSVGNTVTVAPALVAGTITPGTPSIDFGQSIILTAHPSGGAAPYTYQWHSGASAACASDTNALGTAATQTVLPSTNTYYCYTVADASSSTQSSSTDLVSVNPILVAGSVTPPSTAIDNGQSITLTANPSGGTGPYHYQWYSSANSACPGTPATPTVTLSVSPSTSTYYCYTVTDSSTGSPEVSVTSAAFLVTVNPALTAGSITPSSPSIDNGQSISLTANPSGGTTPYQYQWYSGPSASCASDNTLLGTASTQAVTPTSLTYYCYRATDSSIGAPTAITTSVTNLVAVSPQLVAGSIIPSSPSIDNGQSVVLTAKPSGGVGPYSYQWYSDGTCTASIPSAASSTYTASPASTAPYTYKVTDSAYSPASVCSPTDTVNVNLALIAGPIAPTNPTIDAGQSITLTSHASGGTSPLSYQWYADGTCVASITGATSSTYNALPGSTTIYSYRVTDSAFSPASQCSLGDTVAVVSGLIAGAIMPPTPLIDTGQKITLTANPTGGATPYIYQWYSDGTCSTAILSATSPSYNASPTTTATYSYKVTDSANSPVSQCSVGNTVTVSPILSAGAPSPSSPTIDAGQSIVLTSHASGGTPSLAYQWFSDSSCMGVIPSATSTSYTASPVFVASYSYKVTDSAFTPSTACSLGDTVNVNPALVAGAITPSSPAIDNGQSVTLTTHVTGGTPQLSYQWYSDSICASPIPGATSSTFPFTFTSTTTFSYRVTDSSQGSAPGTACSTGDTVTVNPALIAGPITPPSPTINNGQSITLTSAASSGTTPYSYQWYSSSSCPSTSLISGAMMSTLVVSPGSTTTYSYRVTDSAYSAVSLCSLGDAVKVNPTLAARSITPSNPTIDPGQVILLTSQASGGTPALTYQWYSDASCTTAIVSATQPFYSASPTTTTSYSYKVTDSANPPVSECSPGDTVIVSVQFASGSATPSSPAIDNGQSITLTANPSGGTAPYHYLWYSSTSSACPAGASLGTSGTLLVTPTTNTYYCYTVTDSSTGSPPSTATSGIDLVSVNTALTVSAAIATPPTLDFAQSATLSATFSGGTATYACQWLQKAPGASTYTSLGSSSACMSSSSISTGTLTTIGSWSFDLQITDSSSSPLTVTSTAGTVSVNGALSSPTISVSPISIDLGQSSTLATTTSFSSGTTPYVCQWLAKAPGAASYSNLGASFSCNAGDKPTASTGVLSTAGLWSFELKVTDNGSPSQIAVSTVGLTVKKASPTLATTLSSNSIAVGGSVSDSATLTGGYQAGGSVTYKFFLGPTCTGTPTLVGSPAAVTNGVVPNSASQKFSTAGSYSWIASYGGDNNNNPNVGNCQTLTVVAPPTLSVPGPQSVSAGSTIRFVVNATDGSKTVTLTASGLPPGATFSSTQSFAGGSSSAFSWTPSDAQAVGDYNVTFTAVAGSFSTSSEVTLHVVAPVKAAPLPILSYSIIGVVGFLAVISAALLLRRFQNRGRSSKE